jgi:hypothetical protein
MCQTAATVCDRVLPDVPLRQWVMSVPYELRRVLAADAAMLTRTSRVFFEELRRWYREASGIARRDELKVEAGAITFVHRGGGSLNLHVHLHVIAADGVWRCATDGSTPVFVATRPPTKGDLEGVLVRVAERVAKAIERAGDSGCDGDGARDEAQSRRCRGGAGRSRRRERAAERGRSRGSRGGDGSRAPRERDSRRGGIARAQRVAALITTRS